MGLEMKNTYSDPYVFGWFFENLYIVDEECQYGGPVLN